ncbi:MAG: Hsp70 family protein, partial [Myxococcales bacterium]|nr:Hsp70 family protein [Myxococcales bacterium]
MRIGIDFGTTNSAVAVVDGQGRARILELFPGEPLQRTVIHCDPRGVLRFGNAGFRQYVDTDLDGRLLRSLKSFLSQDVPRTSIGGRRYAFTELVTLYLRFLVRETERVTGQEVTEVVLGRPVHFNEDRSRDAFALDQLQGAIADAELPRCRLRLEPVAAAYAWEQTLDAERRVLVGDFGGGTADFAVLRVGPQRRGRAVRTD